MPGESFDVTVTFPEDYGNEDLNGKEAVFKTTLNYIKESKNPDLTDDWVASNLGETMNLNTIDELNDFVKNTMLYDQQATAPCTIRSALPRSCPRACWTTTAMLCCTACTAMPRTTAQR